VYVQILKRLKTNNYVVTCTSDEEMGSVSYGTNLPTQEGYPFRRILLLKPIHALYLKLKYNLKAHEKPDQLRLSLCSKAGGRGDHLVIDAIASQKESGERLSVLIQKMLQCLQEQAYFDLRLTVEECQLLYQRVQLFEKLPTIQKLDVVFLSSATRYESAKQPLPQVSLPQVSLPQVSLPQGSLTEQSSVGHNDTALLQNGWLFTVTCAGLCTVDILRAVHELSEMLAQPVLTLPLPLVATDQAGSLAKITTGHITKVEVPPPVPESQIRCIAKETKSVPTKDVKATKAEVLTWSDRVQLSREREVKHKKQIEPAGVNQQQQQQYHPFQCRPHLYEGPVNKSECEKEKCPKSEKEDYITTRHLMLNEMERGFMAVHRRKTCATLLRKKCINFEWFPSTNFEGDVVQLAGANDLVVQGLASRIYVDVDAILQSLYEKTFELFLAVPVESSSSKEKDVEQVLDMEMVFRKCRSLASNYVKHDLYFMVFRNYEQKELRINLLGTQPAAIHQLAIEIAKQYPATKSCPSCFIGNSSEELEGFPLSRVRTPFFPFPPHLPHYPRDLAYSYN
jgi:hypothetical protein